MKLLFRKAMYFALLFLTYFSGLAQFSDRSDAQNYLSETFPDLVEFSVLTSNTDINGVPVWDELNIDGIAGKDVIIHLQKEGQVFPFLIANYDNENPKLIRSWGYSINTKNHYFSVLRKDDENDVILYTEVLAASPGAINLSEESPSENSNPDQKRMDTLTYKFGGLVEYREENPAPIKVSTISYANSGCLGSCPKFGITIKGNRKMRLDAEDFLGGLKGKYTTRLGRDEYKDLVELIKYIDPASLKSSYSIKGTDDQTAFLAIHSGGNSCYEIKDYGHRGSHALNLLYKRLTAIALNSDWKNR